MKTQLYLCALFLTLLFMGGSLFSNNISPLCISPNDVFADAPPLPLYRQPARSLKITTEHQDDEIAVSPKPGWQKMPRHRSRRESANPWWAEVLFWLPNRMLDLIDIFRIDVGAGPAIGAIARMSKYGQVGYRRMYPFSLRVGDFGRKFPLLIETEDEHGVGDTFRQSPERTVCNAEIGVGLDLGLGGYLGICSEELLDFFAGLIFIDLEADDM